MSSCGTASDDAPESEASEDHLQRGVPSSQPEIGMLDMEDGICTGTLIAPDVVLTAAHCFGHPVEGFYLGDGEPIPLSDAERMPRNMMRYPVDRVLPHPDYVRSGRCPSTADIGLVHLAVPVLHVRPAPLQKRADVIVPHSLATGFGLHHGAGGATFKQKRSGVMLITGWMDDAVEADQADLPDVSGDGWTSAPDAFTSMNGFTDKGDSGGPLTNGAYGGVLAVTSCGPSGSPRGWYTLVDPYEPWIRANIESFGQR